MAASIDKGSVFIQSTNPNLPSTHINLLSPSSDMVLPSEPEFEQVRRMECGQCNDA
jgi:hypothetical protein